MGFFFHTIRFTRNPSWQPWGDVYNAAGNIRQSFMVSCSELGGDLHVVADGGTQPRKLHHAIRRTASVDWQPFNDVEATAAGRVVGGWLAVAASRVGSDLHVVGLAFTGIGAASKIVHTIRFTRELAWQPFGDVTASRAGNPSFRSFYRHIGCAEVASDLHVVVVGRGADDQGTLFHTIRFTRQLDWQPFGNVNEAALGADKSLQNVTCAGLGGDLHVIATDEQGVMWHTIRFTRESRWQPFGNVCEAAGRPDARFKEITCTAVNEDLHVVGLTTSNEILHTIRFTQALTWQPFGSVSDVLGPFPQPGQVYDMACAGVGGDLHLCLALP